jgi:hypothetical protein
MALDKLKIGDRLTVTVTTAGPEQWVVLGAVRYRTGRQFIRLASPRVAAELAAGGKASPGVGLWEVETQSLYDLIRRGRAVVEQAT